MSLPAPTPIRQPRRKRPRYWLRRLIVLLILLSPFVAWRAWSAVKEGLTIPAEGSAPRVAADQPVHILLLGVDEREHDTGRSDTLILMRLDPNSDRIDLVNIPRDTRVRYANGSLGKINASYAYGGAASVTQVIADLLTIPEPYYVKLNFESFERIVDQLDGVDLYVDRHYTYFDPLQDLSIDIPAGLQHLTGAEALKFVRLRYDGVTNDDLARIKRQQQFLAAMKQKIVSPTYWPRIPGMIGTLRQYIATNIPQEDQLKLVTALYKARNTMQMLTLPGTAEDTTGDWLLDPSKWEEVTRAWATN